MAAAMADPFDLERFVQAQDPIYARVRSELAGGHKRGHWMWFIFPQLAGLGSSPNARTFGITGLEEARAYLAHPLLGARLRECAELLASTPGTDARAVLGYPDNVKLRSCMTLFARAAAAPPDRDLFQGVLAKFFGAEDPLTRERLTSACGTSGQTDPCGP
jgi:uncharacterized protein (DUF1810 family)